MTAEYRYRTVRLAFGIGVCFLAGWVSLQGDTFSALAVFAYSLVALVLGFGTGRGWR